jgi:hypothetical protein
MFFKNTRSFEKHPNAKGDQMTIISKMIPEFLHPGGILTNVIRKGEDA